MAVEQNKPSTSTESKAIPKKSFEEVCDRQKRRRTETLRAENSAEELIFAAKMNMLASGNSDMAKIISFLSENPDQVSKVRTFCEGKYVEKLPLYLKEKALAIMVGLKLSQSRYIALRQISKDGMNRYPSYHAVLEAKKDCYPPKEKVIITETSAQIELQALLDLIVDRLLRTCNVDVHTTSNLTLLYKWGFDGASGQTKIY
ncbi:hypothetical protein ALC57_14604 [Trachymyrmex cornetzi]|uniref:Uncharacterized protein n=1 Tax=Trachymyrmex cornetzi TaxID=471704 RepID=A0A151IY35_9HYME|nr:hypothetical protein ALC57_14604 [Trachymyrmex cornetzi]